MMIEKNEKIDNDDYALGSEQVSHLKTEFYPGISVIF